MEIKNMSVRFKVLIRYRPIFVDTSCFKKLFFFWSEGESIFPRRQSGFKGTWEVEMGDLYTEQTLSSSLSSLQSGIIAQAYVEGPNPFMNSKWERAYLQWGRYHKY